MGEECPGVSVASSVGGSSPSCSSSPGTLGPYGPLTAYDGEGRGDAWEAVGEKNHGVSFPHLPPETSKKYARLFLKKMG